MYVYLYMQMQAVIHKSKLFGICARLLNSSCIPPFCKVANRALDLCCNSWLLALFFPRLS